MMIVTKGHNDHICNEIQNNEQEICESQSDKMDQESDVLQQTSVKSDNQSVQNSKQTSVKSDNQSEQNSKQTSVKSDNQSEQNPVESQEKESSEESQSQFGKTSVASKIYGESVHNKSNESQNENQNESQSESQSEGEVNSHKDSQENDESDFLERMCFANLTNEDKVYNHNNVLLGGTIEEVIMQNASNFKKHSKKMLGKTF